MFNQYSLHFTEVTWKTSAFYALIISAEVALLPTILKVCYKISDIKLITPFSPKLSRAYSMGTKQLI